MDCTNLMIDDLVQEWNNDHTETHIVKIEKTTREGVYDEFNHFHDADWIEPIQQTAEILARNFEKAFEKAVDVFKIKGYRIQKEDGVWWFGYINRVFCKICPVDDVHELQHALRLVGLNEVADNLKV